jgi:hypothetical protein
VTPDGCRKREEELYNKQKRNKRLMGRGRGRLEGIRIIIDSPLYMDDAIHCCETLANEVVAKK